MAQLSGLSSELLGSLVPSVQERQEDRRQAELERQKIQRNEQILESGTSQAEEAAIKAQRDRSIELLTDKARVSNQILQQTTKEGMRSQLVGMIQSAKEKPIPGFNVPVMSELVNKLGTEDGFRQVQELMKGNIARVTDLTKTINPRTDKFIGTPSRTQKGGKSFLTGLVQQAGGGLKVESREVPGEFVDIVGQTAAQKSALDIKTAGGKEQIVRDVQIKTAAELAEEGKIGAANAKKRVEINQAASVARQSKRKISRVRKALDQIETGKLAQAKATFGQLIPGLNIDDEQVMQSQITKFVLDELNKQGGTKTDDDFKRAEESSASMGKTTEANKRILDILISDIDSVIEEQKQFKAFVAEGGRPIDFEFDFGEEEEAAAQPTAQPANVRSLSNEDLFNF